MISKHPKYVRTISCLPKNVSKMSQNGRVARLNFSHLGTTAGVGSGRNAVIAAAGTEG